jgi:hypothetical protein
LPPTLNSFHFLLESTIFLNDKLSTLVCHVE